MKNEMISEITHLFWSNYVVFLSSVRTNVGMTLTNFKIAQNMPAEVSAIF